MAAGRQGFCSSHWLTGLFLAFLFVLGHSIELDCIEVKRAYSEKGFSENDVPLQSISGDHLEVCPQGSTCCTRDMEEKLKSLSMKEYERVAYEAFRYVKSTFVSRTKKFDEFFTELLDNAKSDLDSMFVRTYGLLYQQNSHVFAALFKDLNAYYKGNDLNLLKILTNFFETLLQKMFGLINAQYDFDQRYLNCVTRHMDDLKPFGDVPQKLKQQVKRAFIAARTFVQGLAIGRDVVIAMESIPPTVACTRGLMRMSYCPHCRGLTRTKPCNNFCLNTMKGCLAHHSELNKAWNDYIDALKMVAIRLEGPFNIESVVDPIDVKISDAIMNFQEDSTTVSKKIFKGCGQPRLKTDGQRMKREAKEGEQQVDGDAPERPLSDASAGSYEDFTHGSRNLFKQRNRQPAARPTTAAGTSLDRLVRDIKEKVKDAKDFWIHLPYTICNNEDIAAQAGENDDCWNGQDRARYVHEVQRDGRMYQANNPEVTVDMQENDGVVLVQINTLKLITGKLHNAYNGIDVDSWGNGLVDASGDGDMESGDDQINGSGSGSGNWPDDDEDNPRPRKPIKPTKNPDFDFGDDDKKKTKTFSKTDDEPSSAFRTCVPSIFILLLLWTVVKAVLPIEL